MLFLKERKGDSLRGEGGKKKDDQLSPKLRLYLLEPHEEAVDVISGRAGIESVLVFLDLFHRKRSHLLDLAKHFVVSAREPFHQPGEQVVHLPKRRCEDLAAI